MPILSVIMTEAERMGYRPEGSNPCRGIRRYRRKGRERFLSDAEIGRLAARLSAHEGERPLQVAAVRLLLLTGCRRGEILALRWNEVDADTIALGDAKTGPRKVYLNARARRIIEWQPRGQSAYVFPSPRNPERPHDPHLSLWDRVLVMYAGHKVEESTLHEINDDPRHPYTRGLLRSMPEIVDDPADVRVRMPEVPGSVPDLLRGLEGCPFAPRCPSAMSRCRELPGDSRPGDHRSVKCWLESDGTGDHAGP